MLVSHTPEDWNIDAPLQSAERKLRDYHEFSRQIDLSGAIEDFRKALTASQDKLRTLEIGASLADTLRERFEAEGNPEDIQEAVALVQDVIAKSGESNTGYPRYLRILGEALMWTAVILISKDKGDEAVKTLDQSIDHCRDAVYLTEGRKSDEEILCLIGHGRMLATSCDLTKASGDRRLAAVSVLRKGLDMTPRGHHLRPITLLHLCTALDRTSNDHLDQAIDMLEEAVDLLPPHDFRRPDFMNTLATFYASRFRAFGLFDDLDRSINMFTKAMDNCPPYRVQRYMIKGNYYAYLSLRYFSQSRLPDLDEILVGLPLLLDEMPPEYPFRYAYTSNFGNILVEAYAQYGKAALLDAAIDLYLDSIPKAPPKFLFWCHAGLAQAYHSRFLAYGNHSDLDKAVALLREAHTHASNEARGAATLADLGEVLTARFDLYRHRDDIDEAIEVLRACLVRSFDRKSFRAGHYHSLLGLALLKRFQIFRHRDDLELAIGHHQDATSILPQDHVLRPITYSRLGKAYVQRFDVTHVLEDILAAVSSFALSVELTPPGRAARATYLSQLGMAKNALSSLNLEDKHASLAILREAAEDPSSSTAARFEAAVNWATIAHNSYLHTDALAGYRVAVDLLPQVAWLGLDHHERLQRLRTQSSELCQNAASCAITIGRLEDAVELLDRGRSIIWNASQELRADLSTLRASDPQLAQEFQDVGSALDFQSLKSRQSSTNDDPSSTDEEHDARSHRRLADRWQELVEAIRKREGLEDFLRPLNFSGLRRAASKGVVVILNVSIHRCDALIVTEDLPVRSIPLFGLQIAVVRQHANMLKAALRVKKDKRGEQFLEMILMRVLKYLWTAIGHPVWAVVRALLPGKPPRVWWCPTGPLAHLPIHACGPFELGKEGMADVAVSSYIPTLSALLRARLLHDASDTTSAFNLLAIGLSNIPGVPGSHLPCASLEMEILRQSGSSKAVTYLEESTATISRVQESLSAHGWLHIVTHGIQRPDSPLESCLLLYDGPLYLSDMAQARLPHAEFAFLSACHSATGHESLPDEALHLSAGMLLAGYKGVLGTQWAIADIDGPYVARTFYRYLTRENRTPRATEAAEAIHHVTRTMREASIPAWRWVSFVHLGL